MSGKRAKRARRAAALADPRAAAVAELEELYAQLPPLVCKGLCHDTCTAIEASELERQRMREVRPDVELPSFASARQALISSGVKPRCPYLSAVNTCSVYDVRPFVCRAFGTVLDPRGFGRMAVSEQAMMCDYGCVPEGTISPSQFYRSLREIEELSRRVTGVSRVPIRGGGASGS